MKSRYLIPLILFAMTLVNVVDAHALSLNYQSGSILVPYVTFDSATATSVVGLTSKYPGTIYWTFFNQDGDRLQNGSMSVPANQLIAFNWSAVANASLAGAKGYLLFTIDTNGDGLITMVDLSALRANAFFVDMASSDVVFIPTVWAAYNLMSGQPTPETLAIQRLPGAGVGYGAAHGAMMDMRYYVDGAPGGEDSTIVLWTSADPGPSQSMAVYDDAGNFKSLSLNLPKKRLNLIDPETLTDRPASYTDGYIRWNAIPDGQTAYAFSLVHSTAFGAVQTLVGNYFAAQ